MNRQQDLQLYDIMLYRSMQPYPLRADIFRIQTEGEYAKNSMDVRGNVVKLMKFTNYQNGVEKQTGQAVPKLANLKKTPSGMSVIYKNDSRSPLRNKNNSLERIDEERNSYYKLGSSSKQLLNDNSSITINFSKLVAEEQQVFQELRLDAENAEV